jgi:hypothetical protein
MADLGFDPAQLQALMAQFAPSEDERKNAKMQALFLASMRLLQGRKGNELSTIGQAGQEGVGAYQSMLGAIPQQKMQQLSAGKTAADMIRQMQFSQKLLGGAGGTTPAASLPRIGESSPLGPSFAPPPTPTPQPSQNSGVDIRTQLKNMGVPEVSIMTAAASANPQEAIAKLLDEYSKPVFGQGKIPMLRNQNGFYAAPVAGGTDALAAQTRAEKTAEADVATQNELVSVPSVNPDGSPGQTKTMTKAAALALARGDVPPVRASLPPVGDLPQLGGRTPGAFSSMPPENRAGMARDMATNNRTSADLNYQPPMPVSALPKFGVAADPVSAERAKVNVETQAIGKRDANKGVIGQVDKSYEAASLAATQAIPLVHEARAMLDTGKVITGAGGNVGLGVGNWLAQAGFNAAKDPVANTQAFMATQARQVLSVIKSLGSGSGISDADREYASKIVGGDITLTEGAIRKLLDISEKAQMATINAHNSRAEKAANLMQNPDLKDFYTVQIPQAYARPGTAAPAAAPAPQRAAGRQKDIHYDARGNLIQ